MLADRIIERNSVLLRNLSKVANTDWDHGTAGTYGFKRVDYEVPLSYNHYYYQRWTYKYETTNQNPTWATFYFQDGMTAGPRIDSPAAETEYTASYVQMPNVHKEFPLTYGTLYNGNSSAINGVTGYFKNIIVYDVTELFETLRAAGTVTNTTQLKTWCDNNLVFHAPYTEYDITNLITDDSAAISIKEGTMVASNYIECDGMRCYTNSDYASTIRDNTYMDTALPFSVYNNSGGGTVTINRIDGQSQNSPYYPEHKYIAEITTNGTASPGTGGFVCYHKAANDKVFIERFVAKVPVGYTVNCYYNGQGTGSSVQFITNRAGTGQWEEYAVLYRCGNGGTMSIGGHIALTGPNNTSVTWYVAYCNNCDITGNENLQYYTAMPGRHIYKNGCVFERQIVTNNIVPNGNCSNQETAMLPSGWQYDTLDYPTDPSCHSKCSIVQPVNAAAGLYGGYMKIDPTAQYKISYWVKCKRDMTSFLTYIEYSTDNGTVINFTKHVYVSGTKTQLTQACSTSDTVLHVKSTANWTTSRTHGKVGFRSAHSSYNDKGISPGNGSNCTIIEVDATNKTITLDRECNVAAAINTYIVESFDGGTYPYPIQKGALPTDNIWTYVEGYFGAANAPADGAGTAWGGIPADAARLRVGLNLYKNTGTVPIKFCDIKIEQVNSSAGSRQQKQILLEKYTITAE